jgi:flagellar basal-body rod protein FlgF
MSYGLYISAEGAHAQSKRLEVIANNLANVDTVGFKRQLSLFQARYAEAIQQGTAQAGAGSLDDLGGGVSMVATATDLSTGPMKKTGLPTDLAGRGDGFFQVRRGTEILLTRAGNFRLTDRGELVTQQGDPVLSEIGAPITIGRPHEPFDVSRNGDVRQGGDVQRLAVTRLADPSQMVRIGDNLFRPLSAPESIPVEKRDVAAGYLEMSGAQPTTEMVELLEASRLVEANLNMMQSQDQLLNGLINRLMRS